MAKRKNLMKSKKALSPVIATVILVAVTITVAIAVAYWMGGIAGLYTRLEKVEITSVSVVYASGSPGSWTLTINLKNSGSADAAIDNVLIDGKLYSSLTNVQSSVNFATGSTLPVPAGQSSTALVITLHTNTEGCSSGTTIDLTLHSAAGKTYPQMVTLT